jgi:hypothetical protein
MLKAAEAEILKCSDRAIMVKVQNGDVPEKALRDFAPEYKLYDRPQPGFSDRGTPIKGRLSDLLGRPFG